jgi:methanethiol S-methyltransferase
LATTSVTLERSSRNAKPNSVFSNAYEMPVSLLSSVRVTRAAAQDVIVRAIPIPKIVATEDMTMGRITALLYGVVAYAIFLVTFLYAVGFVSGLVVSKTIDAGPVVSVAEALLVNVALLSLFAVQHSVMARQSFKLWWTRIIPASVERPTYVLLASLALALLLWQWRPIPEVIWQVSDSQIAMGLLALSLVGWLIVLLSTFLINHFELFGLSQVIRNLTGQGVTAAHFKTPGLYKVVRHPIYLGFIVAFWATPVMTTGHLLFATVTTAYILVGIALKEHDLIELFGDEYKRYRERVSMLIPFWRS